jgi:hypothetical protein
MDGSLSDKAPPEALPEGAHDTKSAGPIEEAR